MNITIRSFVAALETASECFNTFADADVQRGESGEVVVSRTKYFADALLSLNGTRYMVSMPLDESALLAAKRQAIRLRSISSPALCRYEVLPAEMSVASGSTLHRVDIVVHHLPEGELLSMAISHLDIDRIYGAVADLYAQLKRVDMVHSALRADNIIVTSDYQLVVLRYNYAERFSEEGAARDFSALCHWIEEQSGEPCPAHLIFGEALKTLYPSLDSYEWHSNYFEGLCVVRHEDKYGYVDLEGRVVIELQYLWANDMQEGRAEVATPEGMGLIDSRGGYIIEPRYEIVDFIVAENIALVRDRGLWARFDYNGRQLTPFTDRSEIIK